jgi:hypothetical protein
MGKKKSACFVRNDGLGECGGDAGKRHLVVARARNGKGARFGKRPLHCGWGLIKGA